MIDAYEIGIQLLLQDDVSAGLAIINRELAEVDRAIAATSAGLSNLVQGAEPITRAATSVARDGAATSRAAHADVAAADATSAPAASVTAAPVQVSSPAAGPTIASDLASALTGAAREKPSKNSSSAAVSSAAPQNVVAVAPVVAISPEKVERELDSAGAKPTLSAAEPASPQKVTVPSAPTPIASAASPVRRTQPIGRAAAAASVQQSFTASIARAVAPSTEALGSSGKVSPGPIAVEQVARQTAAPWLGVDHKAAAPTGGFAERAVAPPSSQRERGDGGMGIVMLDGRLVGHWLSEQMARTASRPPGGTSFFDPRQTPAWNVSGAL